MEATSKAILEITKGDFKMADFDSQLPVRALATQFTTEVADFCRNNY